MAAREGDAHPRAGHEMPLHLLFNLYALWSSGRSSSGVGRTPFVRSTSCSPRWLLDRVRVQLGGRGLARRGRSSASSACWSPPTGSIVRFSTGRAGRSCPAWPELVLINLFSGSPWRTVDNTAQSAASSRACSLGDPVRAQAGCRRCGRLGSPRADAGDDGPGVRLGGCDTRPRRSAWLLLGFAGFVLLWTIGVGVTGPSVVLDAQRPLAEDLRRTGRTSRFLEAGDDGLASRAVEAPRQGDRGAGRRASFGPRRRPGLDLVTDGDVRWPTRLLTGCALSAADDTGPPGPPASVGG